MRLYFNIFVVACTLFCVFGKAAESEWCTVFDERKFPCTHNVSSATVLLRDFEITIPPIVRCQMGLFNAIMWSLGVSEAETLKIKALVASLLGGSKTVENEKVNNLPNFQRQLSEVDNVVNNQFEDSNKALISSIMGTKDFFSHAYEFVFGVNHSNLTLNQKQDILHQLDNISLSEPNICSSASCESSKVNLPFFDLAKYFTNNLSQLSTQNSVEAHQRKKRSTLTDVNLLKGSLSIGMYLESIPKQIMGFILHPSIVKLVGNMVGSMMTLDVNDVPTIRFGGPQKNLFLETCRSVHDAHERDPTDTFLPCTMVNIISAALGCNSNKVATAEHCYRIISKPHTAWLPQSFYKKNSLEIEPNTPPVVAIDLRFEADYPPSGQPLPVSLPRYIIEKENITHFYLFRSTQDALIIAEERGTCGSTGPVRDLVPGWRVDYIINLQEEGELMGNTFDRDHFPYLYISRIRKKTTVSDSCRVLITLRPTMNMFEWKTDLSTNMRQFLLPNYPAVKGHSGFVRTVLSLAPQVESYLLTLQKECTEKIDLIITGHSLGAGIGQILAVYLHTKFFKTGLKVSTGLYAAPIALNEAGVNIYRHNINGRIINFDLDPVPKAPCPTTTNPNGWPRCGGRESTLVPTGYGVDYYYPTAGILEVPFAPLAADYDIKDFWLEVSNFDSFTSKPQMTLHIPAALQFGAVHVCSYACFLSKFVVAENEPGWMCKDCPGIFPSRSF